MNYWLALFLQLLFIPALSPLVIGVIRLVKARLQNRRGASILQPYREVLKLLHKDEVISADASWITRFAPYLVFVTTIVAAAGIPLVTTASVVHPLGDFLIFVYLGALGTFFLALVGMDAGGAFGGFGSSREMTISALAEGGLIVSLLAVAIVSGATNFADMVSTLGSLPVVDGAPLIIAAFAFLIALVAENARFPVDNPATHLELTMVHEAMILELSGKRLALVEWASANKLLLFCVLFVNLFIPWGVAQSLDLGVVIGSLALVLGKVLLLAVSIGVLESTIAKLRFFRVPDLLFTSLILGVIAIGLQIW